MVRVLRRIVAQDEMTDEFYSVLYEVTPMTPAPQGAAQYWIPGQPSYATPALPSPTTPGNTLFLIIWQQGPAGPGLPVTPSFGLDPPFGGTDLTWTEVGFETAISSDLGQYVAYGIYARPVNVGEVTTTPVSVQPRPVDNYNLGAMLWELEGSHMPVSAETVSSDTIGLKAEGVTISVGSGLASGLVVGGWCVGIADFGHRITVAASSGTTLESVSAFGDGSAPVSSPAGVHPSWAWIAQKTGGGPLSGAYDSPFDHYTDMDIAGVACILPGITSLPHINYKGETPPNVTP